MMTLVVLEKQVEIAENMYQFRTPTLLNVEVTGPWGHAGGFTTLEATVRHMFNPKKEIS